MGLVKNALVFGALVIFATACTIPPLSRVIYRFYSDVWPPAKASKVIGYLQGPVAFSAVKAGLDLQLFELLNDRPRNAADIAVAISGDVRGVSVLLETLSALDLLNENRGVYSLGGAARSHLIKSAGAQFVGGFAAINGAPSIISKTVKAAEAVLRGGADSSDSHDKMTEKKGANSHEFWGTFANSTVEFSLSPASALTELVVSNLARPSLDGLRVLDVACGTGTYGFVFAQKHPGVLVTELDQVPAAAVPFTHVRLADLRFQQAQSDRRLHMHSDSRGSPTLKDYMYVCMYGSMEVYVYIRTSSCRTRGGGPSTLASRRGRATSRGAPSPFPSPTPASTSSS